MNLRTRMARLQRWARHGCLACEGQVGLNRYRRWPDGRLVPLDVRMPRPCPSCGTVAEVRELVEVIVTSRDQWASEPEHDA
jgi:hypothetical protein